MERLSVGERRPIVYHAFRVLFLENIEFSYVYYRNIIIVMSTTSSRSVHLIATTNRSRVFVHRERIR